MLAGPDGKFYLFKSDGTYYGRRDAAGNWVFGVRKITSDFGRLADAADRNQVTIDRSGRRWVLLNNGSLYAYKIVVRGADGFVHNTGETTQGSGTWRAWQQPAEDAAATEPTAFTYTNSSGPTWAYAFRTADNRTQLFAVQ